MNPALSFFFLQKQTMRWDSSVRSLFGSLQKKEEGGNEIGERRTPIKDVLLSKLLLGMTVFQSCQGTLENNLHMPQRSPSQGLTELGYFSNSLLHNFFGAVFE